MTRFDRRTLLIGAGAAFALRACGRSEADPAPPPPAPGKAGKLVAAARAQVGVTVSYDAAYTPLPCPGGDVPRERGVCTDVVVRAYRGALGLGLQALVDADMRSALRPIRGSGDSRRPTGTSTFAGFPTSEHGWPASAPPCRSRPTLRGGGRLILHNIGPGTREEEPLLSWPITGRYRWGSGD